MARVEWVRVTSGLALTTEQDEKDDQDEDQHGESECRCPPTTPVLPQVGHLVLGAELGPQPEGQQGEEVPVGRRLQGLQGLGGSERVLQQLGEGGVQYSSGGQRLPGMASAC